MYMSVLKLNMVKVGSFHGLAVGGFLFAFNGDAFLEKGVSFVAVGG